jgi:hypothetical protein
MTETNIELPFYWKDLVYEDSLTVNLTSIGRYQRVYVYSVENYIITIKTDDGEPIDIYFTVYAERKDISRLKTEFKY